MFLIYGWNSRFYESHRKEKCIVLLENPTVLPDGVESYLLQTVFQVEVLARQLAWGSVFQKVEIVEGEGVKEYFACFKETFGSSLLAANLLLSDAADYGTAAMKNAYLSRNRKIRSVFDLEGAFTGIPAIIAGAGPSLPSLKAYEDKALIFAGGAALGRIDIKPHFAASIDKEGPLKKIPGRDIPFCFQSRLNGQILSQIKGPLLRAPESHFEFLRWIEGETRGFEGGWTVGNFMVALAVLWGCNPIVLVGMDFCYGQGKKYAGDRKKVPRDDLVPAENRKGEKVFTQNDWLMAVRWMGECAKRHPEKILIDGCGEGMAFDSSIAVKKLMEIDFPKTIDLRNLVKKKIQILPSLKSGLSQWKLWQKELESNSFLVQEKLIDPLWQIWRPVFAREVKEERELEIHRMIFSERVRREHSHVFS